MLVFIIVGACFIAVALLFLTFSVVLLSRKATKKYWLQTTGKVVDQCKNAKSYNPYNPAEASLSLKDTLKVVGIIFLITAVFIMLAGLILFVIGVVSV